MVNSKLHFVFKMFYICTLLITHIYNLHFDWFHFVLFFLCIFPVLNLLLITPLGGNLFLRKGSFVLCFVQLLVEMTYFSVSFLHE